jgi:hypothetical protein
VPLFLKGGTQKKKVIKVDFVFDIDYSNEHTADKGSRIND